MTACCTLVAGRILGILIRCPLVFCTFWLFSDYSCTHPWLSQFSCLWQWAKYCSVRRRFQPQLYSCTIICCFSDIRSPLGCILPVDMFTGLLFCLYDTVFAAGYQLSSIPSLLIQDPFSQRRRHQWSECQWSSQWILKSCQTHGGCPTMSYSN